MLIDGSSSINLWVFSCQTDPGLLICLRVFLSLFIDLLVPELFVYSCIYLSLTYIHLQHMNYDDDSPWNHA